MSQVVNIDTARDPGLTYIQSRFVQIPNIKSRSALIVDTTTFGEQMDLGYVRHLYHRNGGIVELKTVKLTEDYLASELIYCVSKVFRPNAPRIIKQNNSNYSLNLWTEHPVNFSGNVVNKGDVPLFAEYMERLFPIKEERHYMYWWIAHCVRRPEKKIVATPVLRSSQGCGKTYLVETLLASIMGKNAAIGDLNHMTGQFQDAVVGKTLIALDEVYCDKKRTVDALKVFQSNDTILINQKHKAAYSIENYINIIINSNDYDPVVFESHDRRFFIPQFIEHRVDNKETQAFIGKLASWIENENGAQMIRDFLEQINLSAYHPKAPAIMTASKESRIGYNFEDRLFETVEKVIGKAKVVKTIDVQKLVNVDQSDFADVGPRKISAVLEQLGCKPKRTTAGVYQITPEGLRAGLTTKSSPKDLEANLSDLSAF